MMNFFKKLLIMTDALVGVVIGLLFTAGGLVIILTGTTDEWVPYVITIIGIILLIVDIRKVARSFREPASEQAQYDRVDPVLAEQLDAEMADEPDEATEEFVYHFTGKLNQDQVMEAADGEVVYEALCEKLTLLKDTSFHFVDHLSGKESTKMIGHTLTNSRGFGGHYSAVVSSSFKVDGVPVWDVIGDMGYSFRFILDGVVPHYTVQRGTKDVGTIEFGGTGLFKPEHKDHLAGKIPSRGIYRVRCSRSDVPGFFLICFALSRTEETYT